MNPIKPPERSQVIPTGAKLQLCYVNQLADVARHNKVQPIYQLVQADASQKNKKFSISLTLGSEVWTAWGGNKKEARQNVAKKALNDTVLSKPPLPLTKKKTVVNSDALTPAVQLNSLAMAHGKQVIYTVIKKVFDPSLQTQNYNHQQQQLTNISSFAPFNFINLDQYPSTVKHAYNRYVNPSNCYNSSSLGLHKRPNHFEVCVTIDDEKYFGVGRTLQGARHDAASSAISHFDNMPKKYNRLKKNDTGTTSSEVFNGNGSQQLEKSPVSVLYEEALPRNMMVVFNVKNTDGPDHLRTYTVEVTVGYFHDGVVDEQHRHYKAEGSGPNLRIAKREAAVCVLDKMKYLPRCDKLTSKPCTGTSRPKTVSSVPETLHPVSRLLQIAQAQRVTEPTFVIGQEELTNAFHQVFVYHCTFEGMTVEGKGSNKKEAKRNAAEKMLRDLGCKVSFMHQVPNLHMVPQKTSLKTTGKAVSNNPGKRLQVKFNEDSKVLTRNSNNFID